MWALGLGGRWLTWTQVPRLPSLCLGEDGNRVFPSPLHEAEQWLDAPLSHVARPGDLRPQVAFAFVR